MDKNQDDHVKELARLRDEAKEVLGISAEKVTKKAPDR